MTPDWWLRADCHPPLRIDIRESCAHWRNVPILVERLPSSSTGSTCVGADGNPPANNPPTYAALPTHKHNRLKNYDYSQNGRYFITLCAKNKAYLFGHIQQGKMVLNPSGLLVKAELERVSEIRAECAIEQFVIMPNHLHFILALDRGLPAGGLSAGGLPSAPTVASVGDDGNRPANRPANGKIARHPSVSNMVQGFKGAVSRALGFSPWQRSFHDHIIRNEADYTRIARYIEENPLRWEADCFFSEILAETIVS
jgi:REP element-mobilizing transposase RayT